MTNRKAKALVSSTALLTCLAATALGASSASAANSNVGAVDDVVIANSVGDTYISPLANDKGKFIASSLKVLNQVTGEEQDSLDTAETNTEALPANWTVMKDNIPGRDGQLVFTPDREPRFSGTAVFEYTAMTVDGQKVQGTVTVKTAEAEGDSAPENEYKPMPVISSTNKNVYAETDGRGEVYFSLVQSDLSASSFKFVDEVNFGKGGREEKDSLDPGAWTFMKENADDSKVGGDWRIAFTPNKEPAFTGTAVAKYVAKTKAGVPFEGTVTVKVTPHTLGNDDPSYNPVFSTPKLKPTPKAEKSKQHLSDDSAATYDGKPITIGLYFNDDTDYFMNDAQLLDGVTKTNVVENDFGTFTLGAKGSLTFTPKKDKYGDAKVQYVVNTLDGEQTATVTIFSRDSKTWDGGNKSSDVDNSTPSTTPTSPVETTPTTTPTTPTDGSTSPAETTPSTTPTSPAETTPTEEPIAPFAPSSKKNVEKVSSKIDGTVPSTLPKEEGLSKVVKVDRASSKVVKVDKAASKVVKVEKVGESIKAPVAKNNAATSTEWNRILEFFRSLMKR